MGPIKWLHITAKLRLKKKTKKKKNKKKHEKKLCFASGWNQRPAACQFSLCNQSFEQLGTEVKVIIISADLLGEKTEPVTKVTVQTAGRTERELGVLFRTTEITQSCNPPPPFFSPSFMTLIVYD